MMRLNNERLPNLLRLQKRVDGGETLNSYDTKFLSEVLANAGTVSTLAAKHPEYQELVTRISSLCQEITRKGLENAQKKS